MTSGIEVGGIVRRRIFDRSTALTMAAAAVAAIFVGGLAVHLWRETGGTNSYALLADAFLHGRLDVDRCFDHDCALFAGRTYVIFPPLPALVALPFVAIFGTGFAGFVAIGSIATGMALALWWRIFARMGATGERRLWLMLALAFGSPVYFVTLRSEGIWFFAQAIGLLFVTLALHEALSRRLATAGVAIGLAFLCRQMAVFLAPLLIVLSLERNEPILAPSSRAWWGRVVRLGLPVAVAIAAYCAYNAERFGQPLETGYSHIVPDLSGYLGHRIAEALFSPRYVLFNTFYLFVQGFHAEFAGPLMTEFAGLDPNGTSLIAASPFVLFAFFLPRRREVMVGLASAALIAGITLFYHSNGFAQYNVQRYTLDWLPVLFLFLPFCVPAERLPVFRLLVAYALLLNLVTMGALALTKAA